MEYVWLTTDHLNVLGKGDEKLKPYFKGTMGCDELPLQPERIEPQAYIVNTDPSNLPGQHWLGIWTENDTCEIMDSYGVPLTTFTDITPLLVWLNQWNHVRRNRQTIQSIRTASCGDYALVYLMFKARGHSLDDFLSHFSKTDYVGNDDVIGEVLEKFVNNEIKELQ